MSSQSVAESVTVEVRDLIKDNIATYLSEVRVDRTDAKVTTEVPASYFIYPDAIGYKTPACFVVVNSIDYSLNRGQNGINSTLQVYVSIVVEDRTQELLTYKVYRYSDALHKLLSRAHLIDDTKKRQSIIKVMRTDFSATQKMSSVETVFRKEVMLTLEVEHYEKEN